MKIAVMRTVPIALLLVLAGHAAVRAQPQLSAQQQRGEALLARLCADCHALGPAGESPDANAPAFRVLGQRYKIEALEEALGEGLISGHPEMPEFRFAPDEVGAVIAYLNAIQAR
jgi:mono/diheme cytochrome c family protein